ncbi:MAG: outer membrane lipoprotein carrier protein LolA [Planctomycetes bacterium]|nr:outer membrane lipoprotein carrier protein LolA [Planctomycetota bacterium]
MKTKPTRIRPARPPAPARTGAFSCALFGLLLLFPGPPRAAQQEEEKPAPAPPLWSPLTPEEEDAFLKKMAETLREMQTLRAEFVQERHIALFLAPLEAKGVCCFAKPASLRWELTEPYVSILILKEGKVAKFDLVEGKLRRMSLGAEDLLREVLGQIVEWIKGDFSRARELYDLEFQKGEGFRVVMQPRSAELKKAITAVELTIDAATCRATKVVVREPGEDFLEIRFSKDEVNVRLDEKLFDLEEPGAATPPANG